MTTLNEYMQNTKGLSLESQNILDSLKVFFDYESYNLSSNGITLNNVIVNEDINFTGITSKLSKGDHVDSIEICTNGWLNVCNESEKYTVMNYTLNEDVFLPGFGLPTSFVPSIRKVNPIQFANINALMSDGLAQIVKLISLVKGLTIDDAIILKNQLGPSTEERILRNILDATFFDTPLETGQMNGV